MARKPATKKENVKKKSGTPRYPKRDLSKKKTRSTATSTAKKPTKKPTSQKKSPPAKKTTKQKKVVVAKKERKTHPTYSRMISEALNDLPKRGVGYRAIVHYIDTKYPVKGNFSRYLKLALHSGLTSGIFQIAPIAKYRLSVLGRKILQGELKKSKKKTATKKVTPSKTKSTDKKRKRSTSDDSEKTKKKPRSKSPSKEEKKKTQKKSPSEKKQKKPPSEKKTTKSKSAGLHSKNSDSPKEKSKYDYIWQYRENNGTWGDYDLKPSDHLEEVYQAYLDNREGTDIRTVKSGQWEYEVDFKTMQQTNVQHPSRTVRPIRRLLRTTQ